MENTNDKTAAVIQQIEMKTMRIMNRKESQTNIKSEETFTRLGQNINILITEDIAHGHIQPIDPKSDQSVHLNVA